MADTALTGVPEFSVFEIVKTGELSLTSTANVTEESASVDHNLGYRPVIIAYSDIVNSFGALPLVRTLGAVADMLGKIATYVSIEVNDTSIIARVVKPSVGGANTLFPVTTVYQIRYYLLKERAS